MRPLHLEMEGFATFREPTELEFADLDLVAFVGATGAGKSTIIDAITFALYGSVARYDNANVVAPVIHQLSTEAKVRFDFEVGGQHFVAVRVVRRRGGRSKAQDATTGSSVGSARRSGGGATTKEARLERLVNGESVEVLAGNVRELDARVAELIGLDFGQFTRTVVLPQGQFAQFLKDEPSSRQKLLRSLLDLDVYYRMGILAREQAKKAGQQAEALESELNRQTAVTDEQLTELAGRVEALTTLRRTAAEAVDELATVDAELDPVRNQVQELDQRLDRLAVVAVPDRLVETDRLLSEADEELAGLESTLATARADWERKRAEVDSGADKSELRLLLDQIDRLATAEVERDAAETGRAELTEQLTRAEIRQAELETAAVAAREALAEIRRSADAETWLAQLVEGETCPICGQTVERLPDHPPEGALAEAEATARAAAEASTEATKAVSSTRGSLEAADKRLALLAASIEPLRDAVGDRRRAEIEASLVELEQRLAEATAFYGEMNRIEQRLTRLRADRARIGEQTKTWTLELGRQRDHVSGLEPPALDHRTLLDDWTRLAGWARETASRFGDQRAELANRGRELAARRKHLLSALAEETELFGINAEPAHVLEAVAVAGAEAKARFDSARERRNEQQQLRSRTDELSADREINHVLGQHLSATGFEGWLLNEALDNIVTRASVWLRDLSGGSYSLAVANREFAIIDHNNADEQRDVRTLSGGETFLTSLSLALALADSIAELAPVDAPRLESMFLDEGFGTLDGATLDVVAAAIEELASTGRMIGIVTHVRDLAERLPARFEVTKNTTGSSVELVQV
jgi:exonuclease SbcC